MSFKRSFTKSSIRSPMRKIRRMCLPALLCLSLVFPQRAFAGAMEVVVTQPWLVLVASFIGGPNVAVSPLLEWAPDGSRVPAARGRLLRSLSKEARIMALDLEDARRTRLDAGQFPHFRALYRPFPIEADRIDAALSDPSVLPFVAQRILTVLADWDPANYPYYQRRLAEFQARLSGSVLAGRQILRDIPVYDLTGCSGAILQAAGCRIERPASADWAAWSAGREQELLVQELDRHREGKVTVIMDGATPKALRRLLEPRPEVFSFGRPPLDQDYPAFLHDQYISLWLKSTTKPLPPPPRPKRR